MTDNFNVTKGKIEFYIRANYIFSDTHTSTKVGFWGVSSNPPEFGVDILFTLGFNDDGFAYQESIVNPSFKKRFISQFREDLIS